MPVDAPTRVRPLPPLPKSGISLPHPSIRRVMSETRPSKRLPRPMPTLPPAVQAAWEKENQACPSGRRLRPTPDSRRLNPKRDLDDSTAEVMRVRLGGREQTRSHALASGEFHAEADALDATLDEAYKRIDEHEQEIRQRGALDLATIAPHKGSTAWESSRMERKESAQFGPRTSLQTERKGSGATLLLPDFTPIRGSMPLSPGQGIPSSPEPESPTSPHSPFEWDNASPFAGPLFAPQWNSAYWNAGRPASLNEHQSTSRKASQPELDIELARKPRPATLLPSVATGSDVGSASENGPGKKRLGVILSPAAIKGELERRFGHKQV